MFRRAFWFTTGAAAGVWATTRVQRKLRRLAPDSLAVRAADRVVDTGHRLRHFALDVRDGMATREAELHDALGLTSGDAESAGQARSLPAVPAAAPRPVIPASPTPRPISPAARSGSAGKPARAQRAPETPEDARRPEDARHPDHPGHSGKIETSRTSKKSEKRTTDGVG